MNTLLQDLRYSVRLLLKSPSFALVAVITLALGIGANTAIFSVVNAVLLKPLPYPHPEQLVRVFESSSTQPRFPMSPGDFLDYRDQNTTLDNLAIYTRNDLELSLGERPEQLSAMRVSAGFFATLGFEPLLGREFRRDDEVPGNTHVAILSHALWQRRFAGDPEIIGQAVLLSGEAFTVVGVMPAGVQHVGGDYRSTPHGESVDGWWPMALNAKSPRFAHFVNAIGRMKAGVAREQAEADFNVIAERLAQEHPNTNSGWQIRINGLHQEIVGRARTPLLVLLGAVVFVLLIACVNVANLLLARASSREREMAVRAALGAGRRRLIRQLLTESLLIAALGGGTGLLLANWLIDALVALGPSQLPRLHAVTVDWQILAFTLGVTLLTGLLFGLAPALQGAKLNLNELLKEGGRGGSGGSRQRRLRDALVAAEVALAFVLLVGAGLLLRSFLKLQQTDPGFRPTGVLTLGFSLPSARYKAPEQILAFYQTLIERVSTLPGVESAGASSDLPWSGYDENSGFGIEGKTYPPNQEPEARFHFVTRDYFRTIGVPLIAGRWFDSSDRRDKPQVILINESMARRYWPGEDSLGKRITFADQPKDDDWLTVVGIIGNVKDYPDSPEAHPAFYWPNTQQVTRDMFVAIRTDGNPLSLAEAVRREVQTLDKDLAMTNLRALDTVAGAALAGQRFTLLLVGLFAGTALLLAGVGIYGVMAYLVAQRTHEIGIRMALGAQTANVLQIVIKQGMQMALAGMGVGLVAAFALTRAMAGLLFAVAPTDPLTFIGIAILLAAVALMACYIPARRAAKVDPMIALRYE